MLYIKTQDKNKLLPFSGVEVIEKSVYAVNKGLHLGMYSKKERALEIVDEIINYLSGTVINEDGILYQVPVIYEMPKE